MDALGQLVREFAQAKKDIHRLKATVRSGAGGAGASTLVKGLQGTITVPVGGGAGVFIVQVAHGLSAGQAAASIPLAESGDAVDLGGGTPVFGLVATVWCDATYANALFLLFVPPDVDTVMTFNYHIWYPVSP